MISNVCFEYFEIKDVERYSRFTSGNRKDICIVGTEVQGHDCYCLQYDGETSVYAHIVLNNGRLNIIPIYAYTNKWGSFCDLDLNHEYVKLIVEEVEKSNEFILFCNDNLDIAS